MTTQTQEWVTAKTNGKRPNVILFKKAMVNPSPPLFFTTHRCRTRHRSCDLDAKTKAFVSLTMSSLVTTILWNPQNKSPPVVNPMTVTFRLLLTFLVMSQTDATSTALSKTLDKRLLPVHSLSASSRLAKSKLSLAKRPKTFSRSPGFLASKSSAFSSSNSSLVFLFSLLFQQLSLLLSTDTSTVFESLDSWILSPLLQKRQRNWFCFQVQNADVSFLCGNPPLHVPKSVGR